MCLVNIIAMTILVVSFFKKAYPGNDDLENKSTRKTKALYTVKYEDGRQ